MEPTNDGFAAYVKELYDNPSLCDVTIIVDGDDNSTATVSVRAHRVVLATMSDYFRTMFYGQFVEANRSEIRLFGMRHSTFQQCLRFMYCGFDYKLRKMTYSEGMEFFTLARMLLMDKKVEKSFSKWITDHLGEWEKQLLTIFAFAIECNLSSVVSRCRDYFTDVANEFLLCDEFDMVPLSIVQMVLSCDKINCTKVELTKAIKCWIAANQIEGPVKKDLLKSVDLRKTPFFKGEETAFYKSLTRKQDSLKSNGNPNAQSEHCYSCEMRFEKCLMLVGVAVVFERNSDPNQTYQIVKGTIDLEVRITKQPVKGDDDDLPIMFRTAVVTYDLTRASTRKVNIFFQDFKCCAYQDYDFEFSWKDEGVQPTMRMYGPIRNDLVRAEQSYVVSFFHRTASFSSSSRCSSCRYSQDNDSMYSGSDYELGWGWGRSSFGSYGDSDDDMNSEYS